MVLTPVVKEDSRPSGFQSLLLLEFLEDGVHARVARPLTYTAKNGRIVTIPEGFVTDGASIPKTLWSTIGSPYTGKYRRAAVLHDYMYHSPLDMDKDEADRLFLEAMLEDGVELVCARTIYEGVHLCGRRAWNEDHLDSNVARSGYSPSREEPMDGC